MIDYNVIEDALKRVLGDQLREEISAYLGNPLTREVEIPLSQSDNAGMVYVHGISNRNITDYASGLDNEDKVSVGRAVLTPDKIPPGQLVYGTPVRLKKHGSVYEVVGLDGIIAAEYLFGFKDRVQRVVKLDQIDYGILRPTNPPSMRVILTGAIYQLENVAYPLGGMLTNDLTSSVPGGDLAIAVKITLDPTTGVLTYTNSASFTNALNHYDVIANYSKTVPSDEFLVGWIKLHGGMTRIDIEDILNAPEFLNKRSVDPEALKSSIIGSIVVADSDVVVSNGEVVYT